ncbi:MAG TPA: TonB-dependent receptor [Gemmatimonadaceae bacterium]|nr:TonB-dependent receptor [Gemmatimonadaceae bacterium]
MAFQRLSRGIAASIFAAVLSVPAAGAQTGGVAFSGSLSGRVRAPDGGPVSGAFVLLDSARVPSAQSGANGRFTIESLNAGRHVIDVRRAGYLPARTEVTVEPGITALVELTLRIDVAVLGEVTVIGSVGDLAESRARLREIPGGVALVAPAELRSTRQANLNDVLRFTPGVFVQPRFGAADESQVSIRGSGLRNNFHARGVNLLVNGMPYRNADGFTDFESLELLTTEAIEIYKGANALRYGGSTLGGAINMATKTGYTASPLGLFTEAGSFGYRKAQVSSGAVGGAFDYYASYAHTSLDGYRRWADNQRDRVNLHAGYRLTPTTDLRAFYLFAHVTEHLPGSVTRETLETDPRSAEPSNVANRWGRDYDLHHLGVQLRAQLGPTQRLDVSPYLQYRDIDHPIFQVISQVSHDWGAEVRYENTATLAGRGNRLTLGLQPALGTMRNRQYQNVGGSHGPLTRDETDRVTSIAAYLENALSVTPSLTLVGGVRVDRSTRRALDDFRANGDQSDTRRYSAVTPRAGVLYTTRRELQLFANASRTVEPPLLLELTSFGNPGGFIDLEAQEAWQYEVGARRRVGRVAWEVSLYDVELENELVNLNVPPFPAAPFTVPTYRNVPRSRHSGVEAGVAAEVARGVFARGAASDRLNGRLSYTYAHNEYVRDPNYAGNELPGAPSHYVSVELGYSHPSGLKVTPNVEWVPTSYFVNSQNSVSNEPWSNIGLRLEWELEGVGASVFASGRNLADRRFSPSVQVDNAAGRYFEPADRRAFYLGVRWAR